MRGPDMLGLRKASEAGQKISQENQGPPLNVTDARKYRMQHYAGVADAVKPSTVQ